MCWLCSLRILWEVSELLPRFQGIDYLLKRIGVGYEKMELVSHRVLATAACSQVSHIFACAQVSHLVQRGCALLPCRGW